MVNFRITLPTPKILLDLLGSFSSNLDNGNSALTQLDPRIDFRQ